MYWCREVNYFLGMIRAPSLSESLYFLSFAMKLWAGIENYTIESFGHRARRPEMFSSDGVFQSPSLDTKSSVQLGASSSEKNSMSKKTAGPTLLGGPDQMA
jgi:hypothetical protein